jgi:hypothetical protein
MPHIPIFLRHKPFAIGEPDIQVIVLLLKMTRFEVSIRNKTPHEQESNINQFKFIP